MGFWKNLFGRDRPAETPPVAESASPPPAMEGPDPDEEPSTEEIIRPAPASTASPEGGGDPAAGA